MTTPTIVLVGHGMVGQRFLESLADRGVTERARIVVLCEEPRPAYDRVQLTSYFSGKTPDDLSMVEAGFMEKHGIELYVGDAAESVDREARTVTARSGRVFAYDALVLATGSYPFVPPVPGKDARGCFVYRTIEDLHSLGVLALAGSAPGCGVGGWVR
ncbi:FAD-dependent oxidoreductase, partial [Streptomyces sp. NPDC059810]|uniref:FAD-dependent oxidoreductase n=1 Tax=Streptomyces sp. NPDC059810 TaxID=3346956 RepID=UPI0036566B34